MLHFLQHPHPGCTRQQPHLRSQVEELTFGNIPSSLKVQIAVAQKVATPSGATPRPAFGHSPWSVPSSHIWKISTPARVPPLLGTITPNHERVPFVGSVLVIITALIEPGFPLAIFQAPCIDLIEHCLDNLTWYQISDYRKTQLSLAPNTLPGILIGDCKPCREWYWGLYGVS